MVANTSALHAKITHIKDKGKKRKDGTRSYQIRKRIKDTNGKIESAVIESFDNKDERDLKYLEYKTGKTKINQVSKITIAQALDDFIVLYKNEQMINNKTRGKNYYSEKRKSVQCFIDANDNEMLADIDISMFNKLIRHFRNEHNMNESSAKKRVSSFKVVYNAMCAENDINPIVITGLQYRFFKNNDPKPRYALNKMQVDRMFDNMKVDQWPYRFLFMFWLEFGFRPSELHGLRWTDIKDDMIHLQESLQP